MRKTRGVALLLFVSLLFPAASFADSLLLDRVNFTYLANGVPFGGPTWPGHTSGVEVVAGGAPEYDYFNMGVALIDVGDTYIRFFIGASSIGWANFPPGFTGFEISDLDWLDMPQGGHIEDVDVTILNPDRINIGEALVPFSEQSVTFGDDWVRIATGGYSMFSGFEVRVGLRTAPNVVDPGPSPVPEPTSFSLLALGGGSLIAFRAQKRSKRARAI